MALSAAVHNQGTSLRIRTGEMFLLKDNSDSHHCWFASPRESEAIVRQLKSQMWLRSSLQTEAGLAAVFDVAIQAQLSSIILRSKELF